VYHGLKYNRIAIEIMSLSDRLRGLSGLLLLAGLIGGPQVVTAQSIGDALPLAVPGFAVAPGVTALSRLHQDDLPQGIALPGLPPDVSLYPSLGAGIGWDSAPGAGQAASPVGQIQPSVRIADAALGLVMYAGADLTRYGRDPAGNANDISAGAGMIIPLGPETLTLGLARVATWDTALGLAQTGASAPFGVVVDAARVALRRPLGAFDLTVRMAASQAALSLTGPGPPLGFHGRTSFETGAALETADDAVLRWLVTGHVDVVRYRDAVAGEGFADGDDVSLNAGVETEPAAVTRLRLLAGVVRQRFAGGAVHDSTIPVVSAGLGWVPDGLISLELDITRDAGLATTLGTPGTAVNTARLAIADAYARNLLFTFALDARSGVVANRTASEIDATWAAKLTLSRSLTIAPSLLIARRHDLPGSAPCEARLMVRLIWSR